MPPICDGSIGRRAQFEISLLLRQFGVFAGVTASNNAIGAVSFDVSDNCIGLIFTARLNGNAVDLIADAPRLIPTLSDWGMFLLCCLLALSALVALRRRAIPL